MKQPLRIPGGVAAEDGRIGCVRDEGGFVTCLDLESGHVLARSQVPCRPLLVDGGELIAWTPDPQARHRLYPFAAELGGGAFSPRWFEPVSLPSWVDTTTDDTYRFRLAAAVEGGRLRLHWEAHSRYEGGAPPPPEVVAAYRNDAEGTVEIDRQSGAVVDQRDDPLASQRDLESFGVADPEFSWGEPQTATVAGGRALAVVEEELYDADSDARRCRRILEARAAESGAVLWRHLLSDEPLSPPPPPPP